MKLLLGVCSSFISHPGVLGFFYETSDETGFEAELLPVVGVT